MNIDQKMLMNMIDPLSTVPISISGEGLPIDYFKGRDSELEDIKKHFNTPGGSRTLITGETGVGKTSFINYALYQVKNEYFYVIVNVKNNWTYKDILINTLHEIYEAYKRYEKSKSMLKRLIDNLLNKKLDKNTLEELEVLFSDGKRRERLKIGHPLPIDYEKETSNPIYTDTSLEPLFMSIIDEIFEKEGKETIIVYDNLENFMLSSSDPEEAREKIITVLNDLREVLQKKHVHYVLIGDTKIENIMRSEDMQRVFSNFFQTPIHLESMKLKDINDIIKERFKKIISMENLKVSEDVPMPYDENVIPMLYDLFEGNIRKILNKLRDILNLNRSGRLSLLNEPITVDVLIDELKKRLDQIFSENILTPRSKRILHAVACAERGEARINDELAHDASVQRGTLTQAVNKELTSLSFIKFRYDGKDKFLSITDTDIRWMILNLVDAKLLKVRMIKHKHYKHKH